jgi:predicted DNA-binding transcriptional regulator YafY
VPHLAAVAEAVWDDRRLHLRYERSDKVVDRTVDALGLVLKAGVWYLVASHRGQQRTYRISRIRAVECLERFDRPTGFDLEKRWAESSSAFEQAMRNLVVRVRMAPDDQPVLRHALDPGTFETVVAEGDEVRFLAESIEVVVPHLLWLGGRVEVLAPTELRRRVADEVRAAAARYATDDAGDDMASTSRSATAR